MQNFFSTFAWLLSGFVVAQAAEPAAVPLRKSDWNAAQKIPFRELIVQSHRGAGDLAPENTIEAFELGWKLGTYPESDIRTTKDGVIVTFHDATFERVVKGASDELKKKGVKDLTWNELSRLDVGAWKSGDFVGHRVCQLADVFKVMSGRPDRHLYLDIKNVDLRKLSDLVKEHRVEKQVILATPKYSIVREWAKLIPGGATLLWMGGTETDKRKTLAELRDANFDGVTQVQAHVRLNTNSASADPFTPSNEFFLDTGKELRARGVLFQALPWDISDPKRYWELLDLGVMSFSTDYPDVVMQGLREYYKNTGKPVTLSR